MDNKAGPAPRFVPAPGAQAGLSSMPLQHRVSVLGHNQLPKRSELNLFKLNQFSSHLLGHSHIWSVTKRIGRNQRDRRRPIVLFAGRRISQSLSEK
jgi:hypothetical protein